MSDRHIKNTILYLMTIGTITSAFQYNNIQLGFLGGMGLALIIIDYLDHK